MQLHQKSLKERSGGQAEPALRRDMTRLMVVCVLGLIVLAVSWSQAAPAPAAPAASASARAQSYDQQFIKSVFVNKAGFGKDPFFPTSTRRGAAKATTPVEYPPTVPLLSLKGISGPKNHRLAIINNKTFEVGEEGDLKINGLLLRVHCIEIRDDGVTVNVNGQPQKLLLGPKSQSN